jgi:hypothetical protein
VSIPRKIVPDRRAVSVLSADPAALRELICESATTECLHAFEGRLQAIVLTGSLARDEASFVRKETGWELRGDAEFLVVVKPGAAHPSPEAIDRLRQKMNQNMQQAGLRGAVDLGVVEPNYFPRLPAHIFSYELRHCGRVIWGDSELIRTIPDFSASDLSREDAWRLLGNRMIEMLDCAPEMIATETGSSPSLVYRILKLYLDMATSLLVFRQLYEPSYQRRMEILRNLADQQAKAKFPFDLQEFADRLTQCTEAKLAFPSTLELGSDLSWREAMRTADSLWRWELMELCESPQALSSAELFERHRRSQSFSERFRGWLYVLRACGWHRSYPEWAHWSRMFWKMSPRYWIYLAASRGLAEIMEVPEGPAGSQSSRDRRAAHKDLPVREFTKSESGPVPWPTLAADIVWNYKRFVSGTRA